MLKITIEFGDDIGLAVTGDEGDRSEAFVGSTLARAVQMACAGTNTDPKLVLAHASACIQPPVLDGSTINKAE